MNSTVTADSPFVEIVAEIRKQARKLVKGYGCKVSVTKEEYTGGRKVYVCITGSERGYLCPIFRKWQNEHPHSSRSDYPNPRDCKPGTVHLEAWAIEMVDTLKEIVNQFNWDKSETLTDYFHVNYYTSVHFSYRLDRKFQAQLDDNAAKEAAQPIEAPLASDNVVTVDFGNEAEAPAEHTNEQLRAILAKLDDERVALQLEVLRLRERKELTRRIAEQAQAVAQLRNELKSI